LVSVKCLASGSAGNSYAVDDGKSVLLLEAGGAGEAWSPVAGVMPRVSSAGA